PQSKRAGPRNSAAPLPPRPPPAEKTHRKHLRQTSWSHDNHKSRHTFTLYQRKTLTYFITRLPKVPIRGGMAPQLSASGPIPTSRGGQPAGRRLMFRVLKHRRFSTAIWSMLMLLSFIMV
ncbi:unnamed protein product, partial [Ectocarpus sp. 13 AM-2016]